MMRSSSAAIRSRASEARHQTVNKNPIDHARGHHQAPMIRVCPVKVPQVIRPRPRHQITVRQKMHGNAG